MSDNGHVTSRYDHVTGVLPQPGRYGQHVGNAVTENGGDMATLVPPSALIGANGMRVGGDGRLYVAQAFGNQISAVDVETKQVDVISPADGQIVSPDDLAFDSDGSLYATEVMGGRVSAIRPNGSVDVIAADVPVANGVSIHGDRIFVSEFRPDGRILELDRSGGVVRVVGEGLMMPNALCLGPDGFLYFPLVPLGEIWRVLADGGAAERVAGGFEVPTAVKVDAEGHLVVVESGSGALTRFDPVTGRRSLIARTAFGTDNVAFARDGSLYVSHFTNGAVTAIDRNGSARQLLAGGMMGPYGMTMDGTGRLLVADGMSLAVISPDGALERPSMLLQHGFPGYVRGIAAAPDGSLVCSNSAGAVMRYRPGGEASLVISSLDCPMDVEMSAAGDIVICEAGSGCVVAVDDTGAPRTLVSNLDRPTGLLVADDGTLFVSEAGRGRVIAIIGDEISVVADGLSEPHGLAQVGRTLVVLDRDRGSLHGVALGGGEVRTLVTGLATGPGQGRRINGLPGIADLMPGPLLPFADLASTGDSRVHIGCDGDGSIRTLSLA